MSIQTKVLLMLMVTSILSVMVVGFIGHESGEDSLRQAVMDRLAETRDLQARQLTISMRMMTAAILNYAAGYSARTAVVDFSVGLDELNAAPPLSPQQHAALAASYAARFGDRRTDAGTRTDVASLLPVGRAASVLQSSFVGDPQVPQGSIGPGPTTGAWAAARNRFDTFFSNIVRRNVYDDLLLVNPRGDVVYSANKGIELGNNVWNGPVSGGLLGPAVTDALNSTWIDHVSVTDFEYYVPVGEPVSWFVARIGPKSAPLGALAVRFPSKEVDGLMTFGDHWEKYGLGKTGETIVYGTDRIMRSNSRMLVEDPKRYEDMVVAAGTPLPVARRAVRLKTTTIVQPSGPAGAEMVSGRTGTLVADDYLGNEALQAYTTVEMRDLRWAVVAKIDTAEAFAPVTSFTRRVILSAAAIAVLVCLSAMALARAFVRPVRELEEGTRRVGAGKYGTTVDIKSNDEFGDLATAFNEMSRTLEIKEELIVEQRNEHERLLLRVMPGDVAQRYQDGEAAIYASHDNVTVLFAELEGIDDLVDTLGAQEAMEFVDGLVRELDAAAESVGVEKIRTMRNGYLASCGLTVPRLDNAHRTVEFALEMQRIMERLSVEAPVDLAVRVGIDTGTVTSGLVGRTAMAYDMWGTAVNVAQQALHGRRRPGIYVTSRVRDSLGDTVVVEEAGTVEAAGTSETVWRVVADTR